MREGTFVSTFGWNVNGTMDRQPGSAQTQKNVCSAASGDSCSTGVAGTAAEQLAYPTSVTVDPVNGYVYVLEVGVKESRIDRYTPDGRFVWTIGKGVNKTTGANICTRREVTTGRVSCRGGLEGATGASEKTTFKFRQHYGDLLAAGGPQDLLYAGDEHRVQEFDNRGSWRGEILLASLSAKPESSVTALAVDGGGDLYLVYDTSSLAGEAAGGQDAVVHVFDRDGRVLRGIAVRPRYGDMRVQVDGIALGSNNEMAVIGVEIGNDSHERFGELYDRVTGRLIDEFAPPSDNDGIGFGGSGDLYVAATDDQEVVAYAPVPVDVVRIGSTSCPIALMGELTDPSSCIDPVVSG